MTKIIAIDGPSGSGKGTISRMIAENMSFSYLDSGALYRALSIKALRHKIASSKRTDLALLAENMDIEFSTSDDGHFIVLLDGENVTAEMRTEDTGFRASEVAAYDEVRSALLLRQRKFAVGPGLVADGRDMGTVVFPQADLKLYLTASIEERAQRRFKELRDKGEDVSLRDLAEQVRVRDERDINRQVSPLVAAKDAILVDTTGLGVRKVFDKILEIILKKNFK
jgi:cytidylate kinase